LTVEYGIVALRFAAISVDGVVEAVGGRKLEMHGLSREGPEACSEEEKPRQELSPVGRLSEESACFLGEIEQNGARVENPRLFAAPTFGVDDGGHLAVGIDGAI
jgi:hypothetical protein